MSGFATPSNLTPIPIRLHFLKINHSRFHPSKMHCLFIMGTVLLRVWLKHLVSKRSVVGIGLAVLSNIQ